MKFEDTGQLEDRTAENELGPRLELFFGPQAWAVRPKIYTLNHKA
jgi:hypothetical protein